MFMEVKVDQKGSFGNSKNEKICQRDEGEGQLQVYISFNMDERRTRDQFRSKIGKL